jgi:hypothetical protein
MLRDITYGTLLFYGSMTLLGGIFVWFCVPETKGIPLEDIDTLFEAKGWARQQMRTFEEMKMSRWEVVEGKDVEEHGDEDDSGEAGKDRTKVSSERAV